MQSPSGEWYPKRGCTPSPKSTSFGGGGWGGSITALSVSKLGKLSDTLFAGLFYIRNCNTIMIILHNYVIIIIRNNAIMITK